MRGDWRRDTRGGCKFMEDEGEDKEDAADDICREDQWVHVGFNGVGGFHI